MIQDLYAVLSFIPITFAALFHVVNPVGSAVLLLEFTPEVSKQERKVLALKVARNSVLLMLIVLFCGVYVLEVFGITVPIVQICGGLMIGYMGWKALTTSDEEKEDEKKQDLGRRSRFQEKEFYPFTFPFTVGPGTIAVTLTISAESAKKNFFNSVTHYTGAVIAILLTAISIYICYAYADILIAKMRETARKVMMRLISFIMFCIGGQIVVGGIAAAIQMFRPL